MKVPSQFKFWLGLFAVVIALCLAMGAAIVSIAPSPRSAMVFLGVTLVFACLVGMLERVSKARSFDWNECWQVLVDEPAEYIGVYNPHWEIGHIEVMVGKRLGFIPKFERWCPRYTDALSASHCCSRIRFVGRVSGRGSFGHMGYMHRKVVVEELLDSTPLKPNGK